MSKNKKIIILSLLLAVLIVLSRFLSIKTPIVKVSFGFIPIMLCATWLGPKWTVLLCVLGDLIGATLFPTGAYFVGYTISTGIAGLIYGLLLYKKDSDAYSTKKFILRIIISVVLVSIVEGMLLNTLWTSIVVGKAFYVLFATRAIKQLIMIPINVIVFAFIEKALDKPFNKYVRTDND